MPNNRSQNSSTAKNQNLSFSSFEEFPQDINQVDSQSNLTGLRSNLELSASSSNFVDKKNLNRKRNDLSSDSPFVDELNKLKKAKKTNEINKSCDFDKNLSPNSGADLIDLNSSLSDAFTNTQVFNTSGETNIEVNNGNITINNNNTPNIVPGTSSSQPLNTSYSVLANLFSGFTDKNALDKLEVISEFMNYCRSDNLDQVRCLIQGAYNSFLDEKKDIPNKSSSEFSVRDQLNSLTNNIVAMNKSLSTRITQVEKQLGKKDVYSYHMSTDLCEKINLCVEKTVKKNTSQESPLIKEISRIKRDLQILKSNRNNSIKKVSSISYNIDHLCVVNAGYGKLEEVKKAINNLTEVKNGKLKVIKINPTIDKLYVNCADESSKNGIIGNLTVLGFSCRGAIKRTNHYRIGPIQNGFKSQDLLDHLNNSDVRFTSHIDGFMLFSVLKINSNTDYFVYTVDSAVDEIIQNNPKINFDCRDLLFKRFIPAKHCHKCSEFGHTSSYCKNHTKACPKCGGNHALNQCDATEPSTFKCANCRKKGYDNSNHSAWSKYCPVKKQYMKIIKENLNG